jgi:glycerophosphoryl diester phosphodiesterase
MIPLLLILRYIRSMPEAATGPGYGLSRLRATHLSLLLVALLSVLASGGCSEAPETRSAVSALADERSHAAFPRPFQIIAHRGASAYAPENTLPAFRRALELGAAEVELDVQLTRDDHVILFHDAKLDEKTELKGSVREHKLEKLSRAEIGSWFDRAHPDAAERFKGTRLVSLDEVFATFGDQLFYHIELKVDDSMLARRTLASVDRFDLRRRVMITSFHIEPLEGVRSVAPDLPTCLLIRRADQARESIEAWIDRAAAAGLDEVGLHIGDLSAERVGRARRLGMLIRAWGVASAKDMERAIQLGTNGMTIDWPEKLARRFLAHAGSPGWGGSE